MTNRKMGLIALSLHMCGGSGLIVLSDGGWQTIIGLFVMFSYITIGWICKKMIE